MLKVALKVTAATWKREGKEKVLSCNRRSLRIGFNFHEERKNPHSTRRERVEREVCLREVLRVFPGGFCSQSVHSLSLSVMGKARGWSEPRSKDRCRNKKDWKTIEFSSKSYDYPWRSRRQEKKKVSCDTILTFFSLIPWIRKDIGSPFPGRSSSTFPLLDFPLDPFILPFLGHFMVGESALKSRIFPMPPRDCSLALDRQSNPAPPPLWQLQSCSA